MAWATQAAMRLTDAQRESLLADAEAMVARLTAMLAAHRDLLQDLRALPLAVSGVRPKSAAVRPAWQVPQMCSKCHAGMSHAQSERGVIAPFTSIGSWLISATVSEPPSAICRVQEALCQVKSRPAAARYGQNGNSRRVPSHTS